MTTNDYPSFARQIQGLCAAFHKEPDEALLTAYRIALDDFDIRDIGAAVQEALKSSKRFPPAATLCELAGSAAQTRRANERAEAVRKGLPAVWFRGNEFEAKRRALIGAAKKSARAKALLERVEAGEEDLEGYPGVWAVLEDVVEARR